MTGAFAENEQKALAAYSIDTDENPFTYVEASEAALPPELYLTLMKQISIFQFSLLEEADVEKLFEKLELDPRARMKKPGGACADRREYVQKLLKKMKVISGQLYINCPANDGKLRLKDQVSGENYTFTNYHDANIVAINTTAGIEFRVLDLQFEDLPVSLEDYLGEVETAQKKIVPLKTKGTESGKGACYWSITTDHLTF
jgi:hypothetical protein